MNGAELGMYAESETCSMSSSVMDIERKLAGVSASTGQAAMQLPSVGTATKSVRRRDYVIT